MKPKAIIVFILFVTLLPTALSMASEVVIVANKDVSATSLSVNEVKQIFLGNKTSWDNGDKIVFVVQDGTDAGDAFLKTYIKKSASQYNNYWKKQVFTGKGKAPRSFSSDKDLAEFVSSTPGAVGYISSETDATAAKTLEIQ